MLLIAKELQKAMREGTQDVNELAEYLMKNNSAWELAYSLAELSCTVEASTPKKVVVSQEDMDTIMSIFRVRGVTEDGKKEVRGRKRKDEKEDI